MNGKSSGDPVNVYKRVMLKISGESLMGRQPYGIDSDMVATVAHQVKDVVATGVEVCLVIGGGNIFRGMAGAAAGMERANVVCHTHIAPCCSTCCAVYRFTSPRGKLLARDMASCVQLKPSVAMPGCVV